MYRDWGTKTKGIFFEVQTDALNKTAITHNHYNMITSSSSQTNAISSFFTNSSRTIKLSRHSIAKNQLTLSPADSFDGMSM